MDQIQQGFWVGPKGPTDGAKGYSLPQDLEKAREAANFLVSLFFN